MYICVLCILVCLYGPYLIRNHKSAAIDFLLNNLIYFVKLSLVSCSPPLNSSKAQKKTDQVTHDYFAVTVKHVQFYIWIVSSTGLHRTKLINTSNRISGAWHDICMQYRAQTKCKLRRCLQALNFVSRIKWQFLKQIADPRIYISDL